MSRTFIRQDTQVRSSDVYDDTVAAGSTMESSPTHIENDLNNVRSQLKRWLHADSAGNWYDDIPTVNSKKRGISALNTDLDDIEEKRLLFRTQILTDITVPSGQNYVVLSVAGGETPTQTAAVGAVTTEGAVVAQATSFGAHNLDEVAGPNAIRPDNLVVVRDGTTGDPVSSNNKDVWGLLQSESATDGHTFDDTSNRVQISFVRINATGDDLEAVPVADIENKSINYAYTRRIAFDNIPEGAFVGEGVFVDQSASVDVTLNNAIDNQSGDATQDQNITIAMNTAGVFWEWEDAAGASLLTITEGSGGGTSTVALGTDVDFFDVDAVDVDFLNGIKVDSGGTQLNIGTTAGQIDSAGALTLASGGSADLTLSAANEIIFTDTNKGGSTFAGALKLSETSAEWDNYETAFGEVSLLNAIYQASFSENRQKGVAVVTSTATADTNVTGAGTSPNLDAQLPDYSSVTFVDDVDVYLNGILLRNGADATANHDVYPGDTPANGDLKFEFTVKNNDVITSIVYGVSA